MPAAYELSDFAINRDRWQKEQAVSIGVEVKPFLQVSVDDLLNVPTHEILLIEVLEERVPRYPEWHVAI